MPDNIRDLLILGLRNAHALEGQATEILERQAERIQNYPQLRARVLQHLEETRQQQRMVEQCLTRYDASPSALKETVMSIIGNLQAIGHSMAGDEILKNSFASFAFEHFEIASYKALIIMAERAGDMETAQTCRTILAQEQAMADWLEQHLPEVVNQYVSLAGTGAEKR